MNKLIEGALDIVGGTEIGEQVTKLKDNVLETVGVQTETKEALQEASLDQVATTYEALATKVGMTDQKEIITTFIVKGKDEDKFVELHTKIKTLAQQGGADVSTLDGVLTTHELTGGSKIGFTIANAVGKVWGFARKAMEKLNLIHSPKDLGKMVFAINEITTKIDVSKLEGKGENSKDEEFSEGEHIKVSGEKLLGTDVSKEAKRFVDYAETYEDEEYVWGGNGKKGVDCSGLIQQCLKKGGINVDRTAATQIKDKRLNDRSIEDTQLGDLIFFENIKRTPIGKISHVGIIKGRLANGDLIIYDASRNKDKVETRLIKRQSDDFKYYVKDTSNLFKDLKTEDMAYNEHTGESVDGEIQTA